MLKLEKQEQKSLVIELLEKGEAIAFAEYRGHRVDIKQMAVKERPDLKEERVIVTHSIEFAGTGEQVAMAEFMPPGTRAADVKPPLIPGDRCAVATSCANRASAASALPVRAFSTFTCRSRSTAEDTAVRPSAIIPVVRPVRAKPACWMDSPASRIVEL